MTLRVGSLLFDTWQGLGVLGKSFYDAGVVTDVMVVEHGRRPPNRDWYPDAPRIGNLNGADELQQMRAFVRSMDVMLFFETPFRWDLLADCKKSVIMVMHECMHEILPATPDLMLCPSLLDYDCYKQGHVRDDGPGCVFLPVPVEVPWRRRERAEVFVHNAGNGGLRGRNGTIELLEATKHVKSNIKLVVRSQERISWRGDTGIVDVFYREGTEPYETLWECGDVFVFPERFNGLSLPLQEARAAGMLVMCGDRYPMNTWLPREPLIPVARYDKTRIARHLREFDEAQFDPRAIAATIDYWWGMNISDYSDSGKAWAETMSWRVLKPRYMEVLENLCG